MPTMRFISISTILERKEYLTKHHPAQIPWRGGARGGRSNAAASVASGWPRPWTQSTGFQPWVHFPFSWSRESLWKKYL